MLRSDGYLTRLQTTSIVQSICKHLATHSIIAANIVAMVCMSNIMQHEAALQDDGIEM